ncbi:MAG: aldehyde ferredoxin oxidoreductase [Deltaproteobacteria bacterium]|nr:aldehyde ferredoxin oxidoreductase [Deltaproteobacteria bacterium]
MSRILRIDTAKKTYAFEPAGPYAGLGGRALTSRIVRQEVPATCHPLGADNKLVVAAGLLTGTIAANSGRLSVGAKSPLTGTIKESNSGGTLSQKLARLDIIGIVFEGRPEADAPLSTVVITKDGVRFEDASNLAGLGTYALADELFAAYGSKVGTMLIGPAGEYKRLGASIQLTDPKGHPSRAAGRGGLGAVMGSKRIKAVIVDDTGGSAPASADPERFKTAAKRWVEILKNHPVTGQGLPGFGTSILVNIINEAGALPTKNFRSGKFEHAADISGERMVELINQRGGVAKEGCHAGCIIQCSQTYNDKDGKYLTSGFEYETVWAFGANTTIKDIDVIAQLDRMCDDLGLDTIEMGNTIAVAMEGGVIPWGDGPAALKLLGRVGTDKDWLGQIIGNGAGFAGQAFGVDRVPVVKNQALPAYDPRAVKGVGVTYATTPQGADHTAGYAVCQNVLQVGGKIDGHCLAGNVEVSKNLQIATAAVDATGLCLFVAFAVLDTSDSLEVISELISSRFGIDFTVDDITKAGISVLQDEYAFNEAAGFTPAHDQLPEFFLKEKLPPHNVIWDFTIEDLQKAKAL